MERLDQVRCRQRGRKALDTRPDEQGYMMLVSMGMHGMGGSRLLHLA